MNVVGENESEMKMVYDENPLETYKRWVNW